MSLVINNNLMAANTARNLNVHYGRLATSTQRLSSGLRINGAADDAAGLAIRELMRADVAALNQGVRNANDAISMIQVADGALAVIDEKLIRMKELAEQAATGTYNSTQRLMIDSEFQAMASEIQRIAIATDFNGIKLLDGNNELKIPDGIQLNNPFIKVVTNSQTSTERKYSFDPDDPSCYKYYVYDSNTTVNETGSQEITYYIKDGKLYKRSINNIDIETITEDISYELRGDTGYGGGGRPAAYSDITRAQNTNFLDYLVDNYAGKIYRVDKHDLDSVIVNYTYEYVAVPEDIENSLVGQNHKYSFFIDITGDGNIDIINDVYYPQYVDPDDFKAYHTDHSIVVYNGRKNVQQPQLTHNGETLIEEVPQDASANKTKIHFGTLNDSAEDYYYIEKRDCTLKGLGLEDTRIETQDKAQEALVTINDAIVKKDQARAYYGAMQNRLENTVSNLTIQAENLQASESRISDVDVAMEMTNFVRNQILTQSAVAMLSQANSLPQMAMRLLGA